MTGVKRVLPSMSESRSGQAAQSSAIPDFAGVGLPYRLTQGTFGWSEQACMLQLIAPVFTS